VVGYSLDESERVVGVGVAAAFAHQLNSIMVNVADFFLPRCTEHTSLRRGGTQPSKGSNAHPTRTLPPVSLKLRLRALFCRRDE